MTPTCSSCGLAITSAVFPAPHPPECGPPARLCVSCRRDAVDRWSRAEVQALWRLREAAPALLEKAQALLWVIDRTPQLLTVATCQAIADLRAAVALALPPALEEKTDAR